MSNRSRVFFVQEPMKRFGSGEIRQRFDTKPAEKYGDIIYLFDWSETRDVNPQEMLWKLRKRLEHHHFTSQDYLVLVGNWTLMVLAACTAAEYTGGALTLLEWDNRKFRYDVRAFDLHAQPVEAR